MGPYVDAVPSAESLPARADVVIVGGGIIGVAAAWHLASQGVSVVLCEKGHVAGEQSSRNWGWCRQAGRDMREMPLITESMRHWRTMADRVGADVGYRECGVLYIGQSEEDEAGFQQWFSDAAAYETGAQMLRGADLEKLLPGASRTFRAGLFVPTDGRAEPQRAVPALARAAQARGATIVAHCSVRALERSAGRVSGVVTSRGRIACDAVILAGGAWSSLFCAHEGIRLPQLKVLGTVLRTSPVENGPPTCGWLGDIGYRKRLDGGYTIGYSGHRYTPVSPDGLRFLREYTPLLKQSWRSIRPRFDAAALREFRDRPGWNADGRSPFERTRTMDPAPSQRGVAAAMASMRRLFPAFEDARIVQEWACYMDVTPDIIPYIGACATVPGLTVATGFSGHGFGIGPAAGRAAADIAIGRDAGVNLAPFSLERFAPGVPIVPGGEI
ncbi:glycine/D-amino acid oxidase-like deaminating enzyme [Paraburkholderia bannensis]|uniref:Glycine/D-amino acid oxidase-like deaminating enzyme n=1 Tax=Paraburkholderia bannensis TaxID=765414 RepID=A0A7W9TXM0_9BURK|nr:MULTISPECIES: FAD-binding oxidoreductase [Paraburkholderia]MBB3258279.1 glycine/D-amino acid oxidase-like deaminating enzyme [Paraburkholderia sp. WP4_3_2]MBB6103292.1 glycine/D-amino acid oxidase-like deaminating enzyme [Paraburkholderia bannensis]